MNRPTITNPGLQVSFAGVPAWRSGGVFEVNRMPHGVKRVPKIINGEEHWRCNKCREWKLPAEYAPDRRKSNGLQGDCKACQNATVKKFYIENKEYVLERNARYRENNRERFLGYSRASYLRHREKNIERAKKNNRKYPEKRLARAAVEQALKTGKLIKPDCCEMCGDGGRLEAHHEDYSPDRRLVVIWLCMRCHRFVHKQQKELRKRQGLDSPARPGYHQGSATRKQSRRRKA